MGSDQRGPLEVTIDRWPNGYVTVRCGPMSLYLSAYDFETFFRALSRVHSAIHAAPIETSREDVRH
jgi:hypothetical protein